jgi:hypothetical protein
MRLGPKQRELEPDGGMAGRTVHLRGWNLRCAAMVEFLLWFGGVLGLAILCSPAGRAKVGGPDFPQMEPAVGVVRVNGGAEESCMIHSVNGLRPRRVLTTVYTAALQLGFRGAT